MASDEEPYAPNAGITARLADGFAVAIEVETSRGLAMEAGARHSVELATAAADGGRVDAVCFTDNPGGNPHITPETLGRELLDRDAEVVINLSCKDYNRNSLEGRLWSLSSLGFRNVLCLSGDYPVSGFSGQARPVFDTDSVGLLEMIRRMNDGLRVTLPGRRSSETELGRTEFNPGAAVNPFKLHEGEYLTQFYKMDFKIRTGAKWFVSQIGYDARKHHELIRYLYWKHGASGTVPAILGSIFVLSAPAARFFGRWGIPGVAVNSELVEVANRAARAKDRGRGFFDELAAKQIAVLRGAGYNGVYLSGRLTYERIERILDIAEGIQGDQWKDAAAEIGYSQPGEFYLFEEGDSPNTASEEMNRVFAESRGRPASLLRRALHPDLPYRIGRFGKHFVFDHDAPGFKASASVYRQIEKSKVAKKAAHAAEQMMKVPLYGCKDCGDCSLPDIGELCPESQCVKNQRNGPCGGTRAGKCEILDKDCIYLRAYDTLKLYGEEEKMLEHPVVLTDSSLQGTASWANTFAKRDHYGKLQ